MTYKDNITAILECHFTGFKQEIIDNAVNCISALSENKIPDSAEDNTMEWLENEDGSYECSKCHITRSGLISGVFNFCPNCGADMRGGK